MTPDAYLSYFTTQYRDKLDGFLVNDEHAARYSGYYAIFSALLEKKQRDFRIIETGIMRDGTAWSDGKSTFLFYEFLSIFGGELISIDIDQANIDSCKNYMASCSLLFISLGTF